MSVQRGNTMWVHREVASGYNLAKKATMNLFPDLWQVGVYLLNLQTRVLSFKSLER